MQDENAYYINDRECVPVLPLRGLVMFPDMTLHFDVGRAQSIEAVKYALSENKNIFMVAQRDPEVEFPKFSDLYTVGVLASIKQILNVTEGKGTLRVVAEGISRAVISEITNNSPFISGLVAAVPDKSVGISSYDYEIALIRRTHAIFEEYCDASGRRSHTLLASLYEEISAGSLADKIAGSIYLPVEQRQAILKEFNPLKRLEKVCAILNREIKLSELEDDIQEQVQDRMDKNQHDYYLREQLKVIYEELGEGEDVPEEADRLISLVRDSKMPDESKEILVKECRRMGKMGSGSPDANVIRTYVEKCLALPWGIYTKESKNLDKAKKQLDKDHYGLDDVKERVVEMLAARMLSPNIKGQIICLAGPPGVGKTSIAKSVAKATNRNYVRISLGGVRDEAEIRGHRRTYIGAIPGRIINAVIEAKSSNPLILLDEIDKINSDFKGDPASALLEVLDSEQNFAFCDHYIEMPVDLSRVLFITTANDKYAIPEPLKDRMEIIDVGSYTHEEKFNIAKKHLYPKQLEEHNITKKQLKISDKAFRLMIDGYTKEAGVRQLERMIAKICRKTAVAILENPEAVTSVTDKNLPEYLGTVKYREDDIELTNETGLVNGLAWTSVGGEMLQIEVSVLDGTGKLELTGSLGEVMKESAKTALSLVRSRAEKFNIDPDFYKNKDIHIHVPEGAVPKDGPSAGITMTTAIFSALSGIPVKGDVAMTGEITLRGRVLPIGGLKEKSMAAYRHNMKTVIIPKGNYPDVEEIDSAVKEKVAFVPVKAIDEVLDVAMAWENRTEKGEKAEKNTKAEKGKKNENREKTDRAAVPPAKRRDNRRGTVVN
ncbi:MAG: endopeptidase La [Clostridiales bacterium]|nr:endopeptidase La [Clostridiales bacterium]